MGTELNNALTAAQGKEMYDAQAKRLLGNKHVLAHILVNIVEEFAGMSPQEAEIYIEGEPFIGIVPTEPGLTNMKKDDAGTTGFNMTEFYEAGNNMLSGERIVGITCESKEINEGAVHFNVIFRAMRRDKSSGIIIDLEAQKNNPTRYKILNRSTFYAGRLISSQKEREFRGEDYDNIKEVYTIWICMNAKENYKVHMKLKDENEKKANEKNTNEKTRENI